MEITIAYDGVGMDEAKIEDILNLKPTIHERVGVKNTNRRLIHLYGQGLDIESVRGKGTTVHFRIPKHKNKQRNRTR